MKAIHFFALMCLTSSHVHAQSPDCAGWEEKLRVEVRTANECDRKNQTCLDLGPVNPMRELNYCRNLLKRCESLDGPIESEELKQQVEQYKKQCP